VANAKWGIRNCAVPVFRGRVRRANLERCQKNFTVARGGGQWELWLWIFRMC
jgi:hypothetical protein